MFPTSISPNPQTESPFFRLPGEIRNLIYSHCFTSSRPITDPRIKPSDLTVATSSCYTLLGSGLLSTCRLIYIEADFCRLYTGNTFLFTSVAKANRYLTSLPNSRAPLIRDIELNILTLSADRTCLASEWSQYLSWATGIWANKLRSLRMDAPGLRVLRLNLEGSRDIGRITRHHLWDILRRMLNNIEGLERIVISGASCGPVMEAKEPWSPAHYVGVDNVLQDDLMDKLWKTVGNGTVNDEESPDRIIRWKRRDGAITLEVVSWAYIRRYEREWFRHVCSPMGNPCDRLPASGHCSWKEYAERKGRHLASTNSLTP